ncbi:MAG: Hsp20/alpha crystallin family protein, partial [Maritimibacter sp.]|nr:Hsp20/alpha crystallin family protein [Maritimibacter sp.]
MTRKHDWLPMMWSDWGEDTQSPFYALRRQLDTLLEDFDRGDLVKSDFPVRTNVSETETEVRITAELPGIEQKDV